MNTLYQGNNLKVLRESSKSNMQDREELMSADEQLGVMLVKEIYGKYQSL